MSNTMILEASALYKVNPLFSGPLIFKHPFSRDISPSRLIILSSTDPLFNNHLDLFTGSSCGVATVMVLFSSCSPC